MMKVTALRLLGLATALSLVAAGCSGAVGGGNAGTTETVVEGIDLDGLKVTVGSKDFPEQELLGQITIEVLEAAGATVYDKTGLGSTEVTRQALRVGVIDMYWEYTATAWLIHLGHEAPIPDPEKQFQAVAQADLQQNNIKWLAPPAPANNTYAIAIRSEVYNKGTKAYDEDLANVEQISDFNRLLRENPQEATLCAAPEFLNREDGLPGMEEVYDIEFPDDNVTKLAKPSFVYPAVDTGRVCNFGAVFNTSGRIPALDLALLEDDKEFFGYYNPALTMHQEIFQRHPELKEIFAPISKVLTTEKLRDLNAKITVQGEAVPDVAQRFLQNNGFLAPTQLTK